MQGSLSSFSAYPSGLGSRAHHSVFLFSSQWVRKFFIDRFLSFCLGIGQEVFSTNHLDLSVFLYQSPRGLKVFYRLTHRFSSTISY